MEKRITQGQYVPNGEKRETWQCDKCGSQGSTGCWLAPDGEKGLWCYKCRAQGVKSALRTVEVEDVTWQRGLVEVRCCGAWLPCDGFTNTCDRCNRDFNHAGQELAHRSQWGEETGEQACDILQGSDPW